MSDDNKLTRMSIDIAVKDHKKLKMKAAKEGISIREFVIDFIHDKMNPRENEPKK